MDADPIPYCSIPGQGPDERLELHVLVRAYGAAWAAMHGKPPTGPHVLGRLGVELRFPEDR